MEREVTVETLDLQVSAETEKRYDNFSEEYSYFLKEYLFRLFGVTKDIVPLPVLLNGSWEFPRVRVTESWIFFSAYKKTYFKISVSDMPYVDEDSVSLAISIIDAFLICAEYKSTNETERRNRYRSEVARDRAYKLAIQDGISRWIFGSSDAETLAKFFDLIEKWSVKTYEGKHVSLGFLVNPSSQKEAILPFDELLDFLNDDSSAVLSDCIHSVLEVDRECNLIDYHSITDDLNHLPACTLNSNVPIRFVQIVQSYLPQRVNEAGSDKVGVFLLSNGDILLVKNGTTRFVKRNLQWLNLSESAFINSLQSFMESAQINYGFDLEGEKTLRSVYASVLDVSFAHSGGIIAIVNPGCVEELMQKNILSSFDNLQISNEDADAFANVWKQKIPQKEKMIRRKLLKQLIQKCSYFELDRKLRCELIALDGACIIDWNGVVYSFGAIIQNDSGITTGGRSAAAKKLSRYGAAIKISTDGYIDVYVDEELVYSIK